MKKVLKYIGSVMLLLGLLLLAGCGQDASKSADKGAGGNNAAPANEPAKATDYPKQPITLVVPFGPGSVTDISARTISDAMSKKLGVPVVVDNAPGGGTVVGHAKVAAANPDGYTLGIGAMAVEITLAKTKSTISSLDDLDVLAQLAEYMNGITVLADSGWQSLDDLAKWAKDNPGKLVVAPSATGSMTHLWWEMVAKRYGIEGYGLLPTSGGNEAALRLLAKEAGVISTPLNDVMQQVKEGKMRVLAVTTQSRVSQAADIPTLTELGVNNPLIHNMLLIAPKGIPEGAREKLIKTIEEVMQDKAIQEKLEQVWMQPSFLTGAELQSQTQKGREAIKNVLSTMK